MSQSIGIDYRLNPLIGIGVEGTLYATSERESLTQLRSELRDFGFSPVVLAPLWSAVGVLRWVPFSSLTNVVSKSIIISDIGIALRAGLARYPGESALLVGTRFDVSFGLAEKLSFGVGLNWDLERLAHVPIQSRVGIRLEPRFIF